MANPNNAGPFDCNVDDPLAAGETRQILLSEVSAGPGNKNGYLRKVFGEVGGMDYLFIVNSSGELLQVNSRSGSSVIPPATSQNLDSGPYTNLTIENLGAASINNDSQDDVTVLVGNGPRNTDPEGPKFSPQGALEDVVPGLQF